MKHRITPQYRGPLSAEEAACGMNAAARNAIRLLEDAKILLAAKRFPTACSLAALSIEESGKLSILRGIVAARTEDDLRAEWKEFRDHRAKNASWLFTELVANGGRLLKDFGPLFDKNSRHPAVLDAIKQLGLYTDIFRRGHWTDPTSVIDERLATIAVEIAHVLCPRHETTKREMELWILHVGPFLGTPDAPRALVAWHNALLAEGLSVHTAEEWNAFVLGRDCSESAADG